jgi:hypothetical protein
MYDMPDSGRLYGYGWRTSTPVNLSVNNYGFAFNSSGPASEGVI